MRKRSELYSHIKNTNSQYNLPSIPLNLRYRKNQASLKDHFPDPSVQRAIDLNLELIKVYDKQLNSVEFFIEKLSVEEAREGTLFESAAG